MARKLDCYPLMTTLLTDRLSHDAEQLLLAVEALFPDDAERVRSWVGRRIANGDFTGRDVDAALLRLAASRWPDPLFRQAFEGARRFINRESRPVHRLERSA
jgi:hypothetical protein